MGLFSTKIKQGNVKWLEGLPRVKEETDNCDVCRKRFGCWRKPVPCRLCGGWVCSKCSEMRKLLNGKKPLLRWCAGCTESRVMAFVRGEGDAVWALITTYLDSVSLDSFLQVNRVTQLSLPLPYQHIPKWDAAFGKSKFLAKGSYGSVQRAVCKLYDDKLVAVKTIRKRSVHTMRKWKVLLREIEIQQRIDHEYAVKLVGPKVLQTKTDIYIVMELADEDLFDRIVKKGPVPEAEAKVMFRQLMTVLSYLHSVGVVHRDIKPENIMLRGGKVKLADFGFTKVYPAAVVAQQQLAGSRTLDVPKGRFDNSYNSTPVLQNGLTSCTPCGTYGFAAPELIDTKNRGRNSKAYLKDSSLTSLDVFAAGIVLHIMLTGYEPYPCKSTAQHLAAVKRGLRTHHAIYSKLSPEALRLLGDMTCYSSALRPSAVAVLAYPWLSPESKNIPVFTASYCAEGTKSEMLSLKQRGRSVVGAPPSFTISQTGEVLFCPTRGSVVHEEDGLDLPFDEDATAPLLIGGSSMRENYGSYCAYTPEMKTRTLSQFSSPEKDDDGYNMDEVVDLQNSMNDDG